MAPLLLASPLAWAIKLFEVSFGIRLRSDRGMFGYRRGFGAAVTEDIQKANHRFNGSTDTKAGQNEQPPRLRLRD
jgi:hypothetical protein